MKILIKQARIIDPQSSLNGRIQDILIDSGVIRNVADQLSEKADKIIESPSLHASPGWVDIFSSIPDPGYEHKETLETGSMAAAAGGFTEIFVIPNNKPVTDSKSHVEYLSNSRAGSITIHPIGSVSRNAEGKDLAEMYDMRRSGAVAFSDGINPVQSSGLLLKALQYVKTFDGVIIQIPDDRTIGSTGLMHEGIMSTRLGLAGKPLMAEELLVARDIKLARYADSRLHFTGVTSPKSLEYVRRAKDAGLNVTCSVTPYHLCFTDEDLSSYDTNLKVYPPLRSLSEKNLLKQAVVDGTIDCIASHHTPQDYDSKVLEFEYAKNGMIGFESCYAVLKTVLPEVQEDRWVEMLSVNPRKIFGLPQPGFKVNEKASITIFDPTQNVVVNEDFIRSKSKNTPFLGRSLKGKVLGIINGDKHFLNDNLS